MVRRPKTAFGAAIREYRLDLSLTAEEIAEQVGVRRQTVSYWELGKTEPSDRHLPKLAAALGKDLGYLESVLIEDQESPACRSEHAAFSREIVEIATDIRTTESILSEEADISENGRVVVASPAHFTVRSDYRFARIAAANLKKGTRYLFASPDPDAFARAARVIYRYVDQETQVNFEHQNLITYHQLNIGEWTDTTAEVLDNHDSTADEILTQQRAFGVMSEVRIFDESQYAKPTIEPVRAYQCAEYSPSSDKTTRYFLPFGGQTLDDLLAGIDGD